MLDWKLCDAVTQEVGKVGGVWLFTGTRVPVQALFENLADGATTEEFLAWFPGVTREQVRVVMALREGLGPNARGDVTVSS